MIRGACRRAALAAGLALAATGAAAIDDAAQRARIEFETHELESAIAKSGALVGDEALDGYLQGVVDRLFPERRGTLRVRVLRDGAFNAFAVTTGGVYFHTGALLRLADEAGLAAILGHEGAHVTEDHMFQFIKSAKSTAAVSSVLGMTVGLATGGLGLLGVQLMGLSSQQGLSRDHEREADRVGFDRLVAAGYDPAAGQRVFERLDRELLALKTSQGPYFFASHPRVAERVANFTAFQAGRQPGGELRRDEFLAATQGARLSALAGIHQQGNARLLVFLLADEGLLDTLPPWTRYYLAEGYRLRAHPGDAERATAEYERTVAEAPDYAPGHYALGLVRYRAGDKAGALAAFDRFLELDPGARQAGYARQYVERLRQEPTP